MPRSAIPGSIPGGATVTAERYASMTDIQIGLQMFETLVGYDRRLRLEGRLAQSWECHPGRARLPLRPLVLAVPRPDRARPRGYAPRLFGGRPAGDAEEPRAGNGPEP